MNPSILQSIAERRRTSTDVRVNVGNRLAIGLFTFLFLALTSIGARAATGDISLDPLTSEERVGNTFTREVLIDVGADILSNYALFMTFDSTIVEVTSITGGSTVEYSDFLLTSIDNSAGVLRFAQVNTNTSSPTGVISVANIEFSVVGESSVESPLTIEVSSIGISTEGETIPTQVQSAGVTVPGPPINEADLAINKVVSSPTAPIGGEIVYTISVANTGPMTAQNVSIIESLPEGLPLVSVTGCSGPLSNCGIGDLAVDEIVQIVVTLAADTEGEFENTVTVQSDSTDPAVGNNTASAIVTVVPLEVDLSIQKSSSTFVAKRGDIVTYTISVTNNGDFQADDVTVTDELPLGLTLISTEGCMEDPNGAPGCGLGSLAPGETIDFTLTAQVAEDILGTITNSVTVTSTQVDSNPSDNEASFNLAVVRDTYCEARALIASQLLELDIDSIGSPEGFPVSASIALIDLVLCDVPIGEVGIPELASATENAYQINQDLIEAQRSVADISTIQEAVAILLSISSEVQTATIQNVFLLFGVSLTGPFEIVLESDGVYTPSTIQDVPLDQNYLVFSDATHDLRTVNEPYSGLHDLDGDGVTNAEEYQAVVILEGGTLTDFAHTASGIPIDTGGGPSGGGGGGGGGCFIATAAYGTPLSDDISVLRSFRDKELLNNPVGIAFVDTYYRISPPIADGVSQNPLLASIVRAILFPIIVLLSLSTKSILVSIVSLAALIILGKFVRSSEQKNTI